MRALSDHEDETVTLGGWLYNKRDSKNLYFLILRDGSGLVQCVVSKSDVDDAAWQAADDVSQETALRVRGTVSADERAPGGYELQTERVEQIGASDDYPITPKEHEQWAVLRIRNAVKMAIHDFYQERGFIQTDAPILTGNAVEGTSTLFELDYFEDKKAYLTQSGQLHGEAMAMAHGKIYTCGPTFRAEKSKTRRHLTEFWMIEPEMAFFNLAMNMDLAEDFVAHLAQAVLDECEEELSALERNTAPLEAAASGDYPRLSYTEAVKLLKSDET
ncbi:MAG: asparagine--tRNA ligase, partial [Bacteroidetes bacterium QS_8_64_10]